MKVRWQTSVVVTLFAHKNFSLNMNPRQLFIARTPFVCLWYFLKQIFRQISSTASLEVVSAKDFEPNFYAAMDEVQLLRVDVDMGFMPGSHRRRPPSEICTKSSQCHRTIIVTTSMLQRCFANDHGNTSFILPRFEWHAYVPGHFSAGVWVVLWFTLCQSTDYIL